MELHIIKIFCSQVILGPISIIWPSFQVWIPIHVRRHLYYTEMVPSSHSQPGPYLVLTVNSLWPSDAIRCQTSWSTLVQVMACCLTAPSHYLNQCWHVINEVLWHSFQGHVYLNTQDSNPHVAWTLHIFFKSQTSEGYNELKSQSCRYKGAKFLPLWLQIPWHQTVLGHWQAHQWLQN